MTLDEAIEFGMPCVNLTQDAEWCEFALEIMKKYQKLVSKTTKWIPVSNRKPKAGERVGNVARYYLVQNEYGDMMVARYTHSGYWEQMYQHEPCADEIVAWMPLPKPYDVESSKT